LLSFRAVLPCCVGGMEIFKWGLGFKEQMVIAGK
jgi:hypothetical protein